MASPQRQHIPEDLAHLAPGPRLGALLAGIDASRLTAPDCVAVMQAWHRQVAYVQAQFMEAVVQVGLCRPAPDGVVARDVQPCWQGADEIRAALALTRRAADGQLGLAWDLQSRLPQVHEALSQGRIDQPRARLFSDWTTDLEPEQAERICALLLPEAGALTTGQLIDRIKQMAIAIDPEWAARRYHEALRTRRVTGYRTPDGTANLSGLDLPVDQAAAAAANIEALARRAKREGDGRPIDHIRADLFLGMLDGTFSGCDEQQVIAHLVKQDPARSTDAPDQPRPAAEPDEPERPFSQHDPDSAATPDHPDPTHGPDSAATPDHPDSARPDSAATPNEPETTAAPDKPECDRGDDCTAGVADGGNGRAVGTHGTTGGDECGNERDKNDKNTVAGRPGRPDGIAAKRPVGVELRVKLSTLLDLDRHPAEIAGWGYVHAEQARSIAIAQTGAQWRYAVCDDHGVLLHDGLIASRPLGHPGRGPGRGGVVEIQIPLGLLRRLFDDPKLHPPWSKIIEQIVRDLAVRPGDDPGTNGPAPDGTGPGGTAGRDRRFPDAKLRRHVQVRDRRCQFPGCRMPARDTDTDHIRQWLVGGRTLGPNLVSLCRHDHRVKDEGGWRLTRPHDSLLRWTSRLGLTYTVRRPPLIIRLPEPEPGRRSARPDAQSTSGTSATEQPTSAGRPAEEPSAGGQVCAAADADGERSHPPIWWEPPTTRDNRRTEAPQHAGSASTGQAQKSSERAESTGRAGDRDGEDEGDGEEVPF